MKNIKSCLLSFILGGIIFSGVTVFAEYIVTADKIEYAPNVSVKDKIDNLYTKVKPNYTGDTTVTPSTSTQTLNTNGKVLNNNITINAIPNTFKNLLSETNFSASDLVSGKTAYNSNGSLITGTAKHCVQSSLVLNSNATTASGQIVVNFKVSSIYYYSQNFQYGFYNKDYNLYKVYWQHANDSTLNSGPLGTGNFFDNRSDGFVFQNWIGNDWIGKTVYFVACKDND